jgi:chemotaxis-related protein WspB
LGRPAVEHLSTRIIIVNYSPQAGTEQLIGLIAERATATMRREEQDFVNSGVRGAAAHFLGPMLTDDYGVIQLINPERLLQESGRTLLFAPPTEAGHATH